jgi:lipoprotein signal peptidase
MQIHLFTFQMHLSSLQSKMRASNMKRFLILALILAACVASALFVREFLSGADLNGITLLPLGIASLNLQYTINTGVNFGIAGEASTTRQILLSGAALIICLAIIIWGMRSRQKWAVAASGLFAGGGLANAYERLAFGGVFDYLNFSTSFFDNPFSFNIADIYIFLGLILFILAPKETHDPADGPIQPSAIKSLLRAIGNWGLTLSLLITCVYVSWQILSQVNFLYGSIYQHNNLEAHINEFAPLNRNNKESFARTTNEERIRVFNDIAYEINSDGEGLSKISYTYPGSEAPTIFLIDEEKDHLLDVANLVAKLKPIGAAVATLLIIFYGVCWYYKVSQYRYLWRPAGVISSLIKILSITALLVGVTYVIGPQKTFYLLHEWAFSDKAQWYFYFEDSLMTTLMPEVVFANIAVLLILSTLCIWLLAHFLLRRLLD